MESGLVAVGPGCGQDTFENVFQSNMSSHLHLDSVNELSSMDAPVFPHSQESGKGRNARAENRARAEASLVDAVLSSLGTGLGLAAGYGTPL